jgi:predicted regulator of Ras-like GTPase activity (Roadblock/LC7/MglB family)
MFQNILRELVERTPGTLWAMIVGSDGVPLEVRPGEGPLDADLLAAEYATLFRTCKRTTGQTAGGDLEGAVLTASNARVVLHSLTQDYFLLLCLQPFAPAGKAVFEISRARDAIVEELAY